MKLRKKIIHRIGPQSKNDDKFRAKARLHQSHYRAEVMQVGYRNHGNWLNPEDAKKLLIYYENLGVREQLRSRYQNFSLRRDGNMLRSEHIPFNFFGPLANDFRLAKQVINSALNIDCMELLHILFEYWPKPKQKYLDDGT